MRCYLTVDSGPARGESFCLRGQDVVQVGSTEWADHAIPDDRAMSGVHFVVESERDGLKIRDLGSSAGTWVNGVRIEAASLQHGDLIEAGQTTFRVHFDRADPRRTTVIARTTSVVSAAVFPYSAQNFRSGVIRFAGEEASAPRATLLAYARARYKLHLLVNFKRAELSPPDKLSGGFDLMQDMSEAVRKYNSLVLVSPDDGVDLAALLGQTWGRDAACGILSNAPKLDLLSSLDGTFAQFARPSMLRAQLEMAPYALVARLLAGIGGVILEGDSASEWRLYANPDLVRNHGDVGLPVAPREG